MISIDIANMKSMLRIDNNISKLRVKDGSSLNYLPDSDLAIFLQVKWCGLRSPHFLPFEQDLADVTTAMQKHKEFNIILCSLCLCGGSIAISS